MIENNGFALKRKLENLREGEVFSIKVKDLANFYAGGDIKISPKPGNPYFGLPKEEKMRLIAKAYRDLILLLRKPPENIYAEETPGSLFGVCFIKLENGGSG